MAGLRGCCNIAYAGVTARLLLSRIDGSKQNSLTAIRCAIPLTFVEHKQPRVNEAGRITEASTLLGSAGCGCQLAVVVEDYVE